MADVPAPFPESESEELVRNEQARIRCVVFDYGNVVSLPQGVSEIEQMASVCQIPLDRFHQQYWRYRLSYDRGELNEKDYWAHITDGCGPVLSPQELARVQALDGASWAHANPKTVDWARRLRRDGFCVAILSNMPRAVADYLVENCVWLSVFDPRIYSYAVRSAKPEAAIYKHCLSALKLAPESVLFLDDRPENIEAASQAGIHSLIFDSVEHTSARAATEFGVPIPLKP
jgi:putative hydrolase of the HAD superfamily